MSRRKILRYHVGLRSISRTKPTGKTGIFGGKHDHLKFLVTVFHRKLINCSLALFLLKLLGESFGAHALFHIVRVDKWQNHLCSFLWVMRIVLVYRRD